MVLFSQDYPTIAASLSYEVKEPYLAHKKAKNVNGILGCGLFDKHWSIYCLTHSTANVCKILLAKKHVRIAFFAQPNHCSSRGETSKNAGSL